VVTFMSRKKLKEKGEEGRGQKRGRKGRRKKIGMKHQFNRGGRDDRGRTIKRGGRHKMSRRSKDGVRGLETEISKGKNQ